MNHTILLLCIITLLNLDPQDIFTSDPDTGCMLPPEYEITGIIQTDEDIMTELNDLRLSYGLTPLTDSPLLTEAAYVRCHEITSCMSHTRPDGRSCSSIYTDLSVDANIWGENLAAGYSTTTRVIQEWMASESHRANLLNPDFRHAGVAHITTDYGYEDYWVILFSD